MLSFFTDLIEFRFLQFSLLAAILCSVSCGAIGSFVVIRKSTYIVGAIAHSVMGGLGFAKYMSSVHGWSWMTPTVGAILAAIIAAAVISYFSIFRNERTDTVLSIIWALGMALGISFLVATPGYQEDLMAYLFGDILMVSSQDLWGMFFLDLVVLIVGSFIYERLVLTSFNAQMAQLKGVRVEVYEAIFLLLTALTVVLLVRVVGIILVIALMTLPAATASRLTYHLPRMILLSVGMCLVFTVGGLVLSYVPSLPTGPTMIELGVVIYITVSLITWKKKNKKSFS